MKKVGQLSLKWQGYKLCNTNNRIPSRAWQRQNINVLVTVIQNTAVKA